MNPLVLIILDGFGLREAKDGNAIEMAKTPNFDWIRKDYPHTELEASGEAVGLPPKTMGNSEVGHLTIGSGRINYQGYSQINHAIEDGSFFKNEALTTAFKTAVAGQGTLHLMGLLSDGGVHSHEKHLFALLKMAKGAGVARIIVHCFLDGRDTPPKSSQTYVKALQKELAGIGEIGTLVGRYYAMDRDKRWERVQIAYDALTAGKGTVHQDPVKAIEEAYAAHVTDEFIQPYVFGDLTKNRMKDGDAVVFFNFRPDRARELTQALTDPAFDGFTRARTPKLAAFVCMTPYDKTFPLPVAFPPSRPQRVLAELLSERGLKQFHTAETEKYAHVTYFLNGGVEPPFPGEERLLIPSPKDVPTYDKKPEMSALAVTEAALTKIREGVDVVLMNFANPDMVGHSGVLPATVKSVEVIDDCAGRICKEVLARGGVALITSDHGNCEQMLDQNGGPHTAHTLNPVPFYLIGDRFKGAKLKSGRGLQDVAPTILQILGIPKPKGMTGESLIVS
ncbi:MAG TPA: 2,3-bisphosphoglycerate-independent phosphoglycerate mutase [bacterium]|nr:2,3-bisphosphoglycerate-independent phosphoglycerate mutase [bacterium]